MKEIWKEIPGYEGQYEVSDRGRVRSLDRVTSHGRKRKGKVLSTVPGSKGYPQLKLSRDGVSNMRSVHALMAETFFGPRPPGMFVSHLNDVKADCRLENLAYQTPEQNTADAARNGKLAWSVNGNCLRGHPFVGENLRPDALRVGKKKCLACKRARSFLSGFYGYTEQVMQACADAEYFRVMGLAADRRRNKA